MKMDPTERIFATCKGEAVDRVPTMSILYDLNPIFQVLGYPKKTDADLINTWFGQFFLKKFGMSRLGRSIAKKDVYKAARLGVEAALN